MPDLFKALFSPNLLARRLTGFAPALSPELTAIADQWARTLADPAFLNLNEKPLQGQFGENQPFADAEMVFPTISILEKTPAADRTDTPFRAYFMRGAIPDSIADAVVADGIDCEASALARPEWRFQPAAVNDLFDRIMACGRSLDEVVAGRMYRGVLTGLNEAFIIDQATRDRLVAADPACAPILRKMLSGENLRPWYQEDENKWLVFARRGIDIEQYPAIKAHLESFRTQLEPKPEDWTGSDATGRRIEWSGRKAGSYMWYEIQDSVDYYPAFDQPKILWPDIAKLPRFSWDTEGAYVNDTGFCLAGDPSILAILQSRVLWFCIGQLSTPLRLRGGLWQSRCKKQFVERLRIPDMPDDERVTLSSAAIAATALARERYALHVTVRHRLLTDFCRAQPPATAIQNPKSQIKNSPPLTLNNRLTEWWTLDFAAFRAELRKVFKVEIPVKQRADWETALAGWQRQHADLTARLVAIETEIDDRVCRLFGLTDADRRLLADHSRHAMIDYPYGAV